TVLQPAQPVRRGDPERTVCIPSNALDTTGAHDTCGIRFADLTVFEICDATVGESKPDAAAPRVGRKSRGKVPMPETGPGNASWHGAAQCMEETAIDVGNPETVRALGDHGAYGSPGHSGQWCESFIFEIADRIERGGPDASPLILDNGLDSLAWAVGRHA